MATGVAAGAAGAVAVVSPTRTAAAVRSKVKTARCKAPLKRKGWCGCSVQEHEGDGAKNDQRMIVNKPVAILIFSGAPQE